jgi:hypothetical protein
MAKKGTVKTVPLAGNYKVNISLPPSGNLNTEYPTDEEILDAVEEGLTYSGIVYDSVTVS